jgi:hypothetical protein
MKQAGRLTRLCICCVTGKRRAKGMPLSRGTGSILNDRSAAKGGAKSKTRCRSIVRKFPALRIGIAFAEDFIMYGG